MSVMKPDKGFTLKLIYDNEIKQIPKLNLLVFNKFEDSTMDFKILEIEEEAEVIVSTSNNVDLKVIDPKNWIYVNILDTKNRIS